MGFIALNFSAMNLAMASNALTIAHRSDIVDE